MTLARPSRRPLRGLLRMTFFLNAIINLRHPEEARSAVSKDARRACRVEMRQPTETAALHRGWLYTLPHDVVRHRQAALGPGALRLDRPRRDVHGDPGRGRRARRAGRDDRAAAARIRLG